METKTPDYIDELEAIWADSEPVKEPGRRPGADMGMRIACALSVIAVVLILMQFFKPV